MKHPRLLFLAAAASAWCLTYPLSALACDQHTKGTSASNASSASKSGGASCCTAAEKGASAASMDHCAKGASATTASTASMDHCAKGASATTASTASMDHCAKGASASAAGADHCAKGAAAKASASCPMHGMAMIADAGGCPSSGSAAADHDCAICFDELQCQDALRGLSSARAQVVTLRNGAMVVYTAESPGDVRKLQAAVARHHERVMSALAGSSGAKLCGGCKEFRGAAASGKFVRELVNVKNGCQILLTSSDREIVNRIHDMTGAQTAARIKS
jgi:hypothetical protein